MRLSTTLRAGSVVLMLALLGLTTACASGPSESASTDAGTDGSSGAETPADSSENSLDGDYAFGTDRDQIATAIEGAFETDNGKAEWDGDTLVLSVDGDATETMAGFQECMILKQLLTEDDLSVIRFPNGDASCEEVLADI